jgi:thiol:disulfide interchange protein DsbC
LCFFTKCLCYNFSMRKLILIVTVLSLTVLFGYGNAIAFPKGTEKECIKCHTLSDEQATEVLKPFAPDVKILYIKQSPLTGIWEIGIESGAKKNIVYLDYGKKMLLLGNLIDAKTKTNYYKVSFDEINKIDVSQIPLDNALVMGDKDAKNKVIVFDDPE